MKNYPQMSEKVKIPLRFPNLNQKIHKMTHQSEKALNHFDNIRYDYNAFIIGLVRKDDTISPKTKTKQFKDKPESFPLLNSPIKLAKTFDKTHLHISPLPKRSYIPTNPHFFLNPESFASPERSISPREAKHYLFQSINSIPNEQHIKTNSSPLTTEQRLFTTCEEIEGKCYTIRRRCKKKNNHNYLKKFIKKENNIKKQTQLDELRYKKSQVGMAPLMNIKINNRRILHESDCIGKMDDNLAYKANKTINNIFYVQKKPNYFTKESYIDYNDIKHKRKKNIMEIRELMQDNKKEHYKFCQTYKSFVNK